MDIRKMFEEYGIGVMATAGADGAVNTAVYGRPRQPDDETLVWGMTEGRTCRNLTENPRASFLLKTTDPGFLGVRIALRLLRTEESGEMLEEVRRHTAQVVGRGAGAAVTRVAYFSIEEIRPLV